MTRKKSSFLIYRKRGFLFQDALSSIKCSVIKSYKMSTITNIIIIINIITVIEFIIAPMK